MDEVASSKSRGRPRNHKQRNDGPRTKAKRSPQSLEPTAVGGNHCPACELRHSLQDCFYAFPDKQPEWFRPNPIMVKLVKLRLENDPTLQESLRMTKRARLQAPTIKLSHTPTPSRITETDDE